MTIYNYFIESDEIRQERIKKENDDEEDWLKEQLNEWICRTYSENKFLYDIPSSRILKEKIRLRREYRKDK